MSGKTTLPNFKALLGTAKLPERTVPVCLRGDLVAEHEELERQLADLNRRPSDSLAGNGAAEVAEQIEALQEQMAASTVIFRLRALPKPKWRALLAEHPPRRDDDGNPNPDDAQIGVNLETFWDAIARACIVEPDIDDETWETLTGSEGVLTDNQVGRLADAAWSVNRGDVDVPFSRAASHMRRTTGTASSSPND